MMYGSITLIVSPYHVGLKGVRVGRGPGALVNAGLVKMIEAQLPQGVTLKVKEIPPVETVLTKIEGDIGRSFAVQRHVSRAVQEAVLDGSWPLVLSGNCMNVVGVNAGLNPTAQEGTSEQYAPLASREVIWFDAHADLEAPHTTASGYLDGMGGSMLMGEGFDNLLNGIPGYQTIEGPQLLGVGFRDFSDFEKEKIAKRNIRTVWGNKPVDSGHYASDLKDKMAQEGHITDCVLHVDVDVLDPSVGRANEFAVGGGLGSKDLIECMEVIADKRNVLAMHIASLSPEYEGWENVAQTAIAAVGCMIRKISPLLND